MSAKNYGRNSNYQRQEHEYRAKALKLFPWVCGRCAREFSYSKLRELTVHHIDHDHGNNPSDGSNWELLCLYCHDLEHTKYVDAGNENQPSTTQNNRTEETNDSATYQPFANLKKLLDSNSSS